MPYQATIDEVTPAEWEHAGQAFADYTIYQTWAYQQGRAERDHQQVHRVVLRDQSGRVRSLCHVRVKTVEAGAAARGVRPVGASGASEDGREHRFRRDV